MKKNRKHGSGPEVPHQRPVSNKPPDEAPRPKSASQSAAIFRILLRDRQHTLVFVYILYLTVLVAYLAIWPDAAMLKYAAVLMAVTLAASIPELARDSTLIVRLSLICVPAIGTALVELIGAHQNEMKQFELSNRVQTLQLREFRDEIRAREAKARDENIQLDPRELVQGLQNADKGFLVKAKWFALQTAEQPDQRAHDQEMAYRAAADYLSRDVKPRYAAFLATAEQRSLSDLKAELVKFIDILEPAASQYRIGGLHNHIGLIALAAGQPERALAHFYSGISIDPEHLPLYDSLGYALWAVNENSSAAWKCAGDGIAIAMRLRSKSWSSSSSEWKAYVDGLSTHLKLQYSYFSALELRNEATARLYAEDLFASEPTDPEYADTLAFVIMRFAKDGVELQRAAGLFHKALEAATVAKHKVTIDLVERHQRELSDLIRQFEGRSPVASRDLH